MPFDMVEVEESIRSFALHRALQASLGSRQLNAAESAQEQDALRFNVGELLGDIDAGCATQWKENGRRAVLCHSGNLLVPMRDDVAKPSLAIVSPEVKRVAVGNDVRTVGDEEDRLEPDALLPDVALSVALLRGVSDVAQTLDVLPLKSLFIVQHTETAPTTGRAGRVIFKQNELQESVGTVGVVFV